MSLGLKRPILNGEMNFPFCLAPMVGLSHVAMRGLVNYYLPEEAKVIWPTEMLNSRKLPRETLGETPETQKLTDSEQGLVPQILGNDEECIQKSILKLKDWGAVGIDINMGCPVKKALKHNYGVALMGDKDYAKEVARMAVQSSDLPVSVKLRAGTQNDMDYLLGFVAGLQEVGVSWLTLHPRTAEQKRRGKADWAQIKRVRQNVDVPVMGNGDIQVYTDALQMLEETECDAVMIGRALTARPWMLWQLGEHFGMKPPVHHQGPAPQTAEEEAAEYGRALLYLVGLFRRYYAESLGLRKFLFYIKVSHVWLDFGHRLFAKVSQAKSYDELEQTLAEFFFNKSFRMSKKTELRY